MPMSSPMMNRMLGFLSCACAAVTMNATHRATAHCFSFFRFGFIVFCLSNRCVCFRLQRGRWIKLNYLAALKPPWSYTHPHSHWSPACSPSAPCSPVHLLILVHLSGFKILLREFIFGAELLVFLVLLRSTDVGLVMSHVRENVVGLPGFLDHRDLAWRELLEFLLLRGRFGRDRLKAGGHQHALFTLRAGLSGGASDHQRQQSEGTDHFE